MHAYHLYWIFYVPLFVARKIVHYKKNIDARWRVHDSGRAVITKCIFGNTTLQPSISYTLVHVYGLHTSVRHVWTVQITELQKGMQLTISTDSTRYTLRRCPLHQKNLSRRGVLKKSDYHGGCTLHATQCSYGEYQLYVDITEKQGDAGAGGLLHAV